MNNATEFRYPWTLRRPFLGFAFIGGTTTFAYASWKAFTLYPHGGFLVAGLLASFLLLRIVYSLHILVTQFPIAYKLRNDNLVCTMFLGGVITLDAQSISKIVPGKTLDSKFELLVVSETLGKPLGIARGLSDLPMLLEEIRSRNPNCSITKTS